MDIVTMEARMCFIELHCFQWPWVTPVYPKPPHFPHFVSTFISLYWVEIETSYLVGGLILGSPSPRKTNLPWKGHGQVTWTIFGGINHIKFCTLVTYIKSEPTYDKPHLKGVWSESHDPFLGRLYKRIDLIKPISNVRRSMHTLIRPQKVSSISMKFGM